MYFLQRSARRCLVRNLSRFSGVHVPHRLSIERVIHHVGSHRVVTVRDPGRIFHRSFSPLQHRLRKSGHVSPPPTHPRHHSRTAVPIRAGRAKYLRDIVGAGVLWRQQSCCQPPFCRHTNTSADLLLDRDSSLVRYAPFEAKVCQHFLSPLYLSLHPRSRA